MRGSVQFRLAAVLIAGACALAAVPLAAQGSYSPYNESASAAMARYIRNLASDPKNFESLIGAGRAALALDDPQAAAGFFARADEVNPRSPLPQAGMGAVSVANGDARAALPYFKRAQQLGASATSIACDRGLAYDLLGQQAQAQADYRLALSGSDSDEARKRLALSLAVSGDRSAAIEALAPLAAKGDSGVPRVRAFVLALTGDFGAAMNAANAAMPGSGANAAPYLQRLAALSAAQKAAAVNLGIFPASNERLAGIEDSLRPSVAPPASAVQVAYPQPPAPASVQRTATLFQPKIWLELATGEDVDALATKFRRLKATNPDLFEGISPYVGKSADRNRLLVGPFRGPSDAAFFAEDMQSIGVNASRFINSESDRIAPLPVE
jgi:Flp pilus assembly protein TadD